MTDRVCHLTRLSPELIVDITLWSQTLWWKDMFSAHDPFAGVRRYMLEPPLAEIEPRPCCNGLDGQCRRPQCITVSVPASSRSPAHCLSQTGSYLRELLLRPEHAAVWKLDNTLFKTIAERSGVERPMVNERETVKYGAPNLVAVHVCACLIPAIGSFYHGLSSVKLALPLHPHDTVHDTNVLSQFLIEKAIPLDPPLRQFTLEIYRASPYRPRSPVMRMIPIESRALLISRFASSDIFYYSSTLTSLYLYHSLAWEPWFDASLSAALEVCSESLEYLTIDAGGATFHNMAVVHLPYLRFLRLVASQASAPNFLRSVVLSVAIDLHLELVVTWRRDRLRYLPVEAPFTIRFSDIEELQIERGDTPLPEYFAALKAPNRTTSMFPLEPPLPLMKNVVWPRMNTVGLDVRIDPSTSAGERAAGRFPEYFGVSIATSTQELLAVLADPMGRDWRRSERTFGKKTARRSIAIRDGELSGVQRDKDRNLAFPKILYDVLHYVVHNVVNQTPDYFASTIHGLVFAKDSWLPDRSLGYLELLSDFSHIKFIGFASPLLPRGVQFTEEMEGCLAPAHLEALALFLNTPQQVETKDDCHLWPCKHLQKVCLLATTDELENSQLPERSRLESLFNSTRRLSSGARLIEVDFDGFPQ